MKAMKTVLILSLMLTANIESLALTHHQPVSRAIEQTGHLKGTVVDFISGAWIARATIVFEGSRITRSVITGEGGSYEVELPIDVYRISVKRLGFCLARRAVFRVQPSSETRIDFTLVPCAMASVGITKNGQYKGEMCSDVRPFDYDSFQVSSSPDVSLELLLRFGERREDENGIEYEGAAVKHLVFGERSREVLEKHKYLGVMVSYDSLTIYADKVRLTKKTFEIEAHGNVVVEDGKKRTEARSVKIKFEASKPILELIR